jgi:RNA-binding protein Musashi
VPTEAEGDIASPTNSTPASPADTASSGNDGNGATSPVSLADSQTLETSGEKPTKIFIGGLSWQTSFETLKEFFESNFGEVTECHIMKDQVTKKSRGFGFVTFKEAETVDKVLEAHAEEPIYIDDKLIDPKIAVPPKKVSNRVHVKRIFVGGLSSDTTEEDLKDYFEQFGAVTEAQLMFDRNTNRHRGFGFVSFEAEEPAEKVCSIQFHDIRGKKVEVKVAQTKEQMQYRGRAIPVRPSAPNYGYPVASFGPYFHGNYPYDMSMGYVHGPVMYPGMKLRGRRDYHGPTYYGGYIDQRVPSVHGYYPPGGPGGFGGVPIPQLIRGQHYMEAPHMMHNMDYVTDQFQGMALNSSYPGGGGRGGSGSYGNESNSPPYTQTITTYDPSNGYDPSSSNSSGNGSFSPSSPPSQVPAFTGSPPNSYAVSY